ncbi:MAG: UDP-N-acetylmuramoyl-L-alanine--D-glutamate ligase [Candidatus Omnitrophica bacterium]|nr:UDP-N-acetylmuramoyl-L-alanine--D-glutamate ligase [Candidatus Omnitrophota bacterium]
MNVKNKTITVVGLGNSGVNAALLLQARGAMVKITDSADTPATERAARRLEEAGVLVETGGHSEGFVKGSDLVVLSPGVEDSSPVIKWAAQLGIPVMGEMELGYRFCKGKIIAITGTNGKSTVTTLIGEMLKMGGKDTVVCGNIGNSLCGEIPRIKDDTWVVLEVSSFQLEKIEKFKPAVAVILNIRDDHMDRYTKFSDYFNEKLKIFAKQDVDDFLILNKDADELKNIPGMADAKKLFYSRLGRTGGAYVEDGKFFCTLRGKTEEICRVTDMRLKGLHNVENAMASMLAAGCAGVDASSIKKALISFTGLAHRFETVDTIDGVEYVDDSKGTTVDSTRRALESCTKPVILIAGGKDKHSDYSAVRDIVKEKVKRIVLIGEARGAIRSALTGTVEMVEACDMRDAVSMARSFATADSLVLLSPMCSSFDMFSSYKERGEVFKRAVKELKNAGSGVVE